MTLAWCHCNVTLPHWWYQNFSDWLESCWTPLKVWCSSVCPSLIGIVPVPHFSIIPRIQICSTYHPRCERVLWFSLICIFDKGLKFSRLSMNGSVPRLQCSQTWYLVIFWLSGYLDKSFIQREPMSRNYIYIGVLIWFTCNRTLCYLWIRVDEFKLKNLYCELWSSKYRYFRVWVKSH